MPTPSRGGTAPQRPRPPRAATIIAALTATTLLLLAASARRRAWAEGGDTVAPLPKPPRRAAAGNGGGLVALVGVFTAAAVVDADAVGGRFDYAARRTAARESWFPRDAATAAALEWSTGVRVRFVVGTPPTRAAAAALDAEERAHGDFLRLNVADNYDSLPHKTTAFMAAGVASGARFIIKCDDDVWLRLDRIPHAASQWDGLAGGEGADAIGCAKNGPVFDDPAQRWHEPAAPLLGPSYFTNLWGSAYVLSGRAAAIVASFAPRGRYLANEDTTLALWLLAHGGIHYYGDRRLCSPTCDDSALAVYDYPECAGLCDPIAGLRDLARTCVGGGVTAPLVPQLIRLDGM